MAKLKHTLNWEYHQYRVGKRDVEKLRTVQIGRTTYKVYHRLDCRHYSDHGHETDVASKRYYVRIDIHGASVPMFLDVLMEAGLDVVVVKWKAK